MQALLTFVIKKASKILKFGSYSRNGRNSYGRICVFHRGGGFEKKYRLIDFNRHLNLEGHVYKILYDPNRTAFIGLIFYENGFFSYIILADNLKAGNKIYSGVDFNKKFLSLGSSNLLKNLPLFSILNNVELKKNEGSKLARSAGSGCVIISKAADSVTLRMKSGWLLNISSLCVAALGYSSHSSHLLEPVKKAGKNRGKGIRPTVRGVAMNPCDHPHGGGNGKSSPPRAPLSPWGKMTNGPHTKKKIDKLRRKMFKKIR